MILPTTSLRVLFILLIGSMLSIIELPGKTVSYQAYVPAAVALRSTEDRKRGK